jgi:hypothetical protein
MAVNLSALRAGCLFPEEYSWYSFLLEVESTLKKFDELIENRTGNFRLETHFLNHYATSGGLL